MISTGLANAIVGEEIIFFHFSAFYAILAYTLKEKHDNIISPMKSTRETSSMTVQQPAKEARC